MRQMRTVTWIVGVSFTGLILLTGVGFMAQMDVVVRTPGELRPAKYAELRPPVEGIAVEVYKREGDSVQSGEPVLRIDARNEELERERLRREAERLDGDLKDRTRKRAEAVARLELTRASVKVAEADVEAKRAQHQQALAQHKQAAAVPDALEFQTAEERLRQQEIALKDAEKNVEDLKLLFEKGMVSEQNLHKATSAVETAVSEKRVRENALAMLKQTRFGTELEKAKADCAAQKAALDGAMARLEERRGEVKLCELAAQDESETRRLESELARTRLAEERLTKAIEEKLVRAPIAGILHDFHAKPGQTVTHKERAGWVYDVSGFLFYGRAPQVDLPYVEKGQPAQVYFDALPYRLEGTWPAAVYVASQVAGPPTGNSGESILPLPGAADAGPQALVVMEVLPGDRNDRLRVGFTGYAEITVGRSSLVDILFSRRTTASTVARK